MLLLALGLALGLGLAEIACRVREAVRCVDRSDLFWEPHRYYGWTQEPHGRGWSQRCLAGNLEWRTYSRINGAGFRDDEVASARDDRVRILVLGDSFPEALQVDQETGFTALLERELEADGVRAEVVNAAVGAWSTDNQLLFYEHDGWRYDADLVLLAFFTGNDVLDNHQALSATRGEEYLDKPYFALADGRLVRRNFPLPPESTPVRVTRALRHALQRHLALYRLVSWLTLPRVAEAAPPLTGTAALLGVYQRDYPEAWREAWRITRGLVLRLRREVERRGSRFAVVVINDRQEVARDYWTLAMRGNPALDPAAFDRDRPQRLLTSFLARRGIPAISLLEPFRHAFGTTARPGFFAWDGHWDRPGHALAAAEIAAALQTRGLLAR